MDVYGGDGNSLLGCLKNWEPPNIVSFFMIPSKSTAKMLSNHWVSNHWTMEILDCLIRKLQVLPKSPVGKRPKPIRLSKCKYHNKANFIVAINYPTNLYTGSNNVHIKLIVDVPIKKKRIIHHGSPTRKTIIKCLIQ